VLANLDAEHVGLDRAEWAEDNVWGVRLHVRGIELAGAADQEQEDAVHVAAGVAGYLKVAKRKAHRAGGQGADAEEVAASQAVAEVHPLVGSQGQHGSLPVKGQRDTLIW
jgi:hypothetical protein